MKFILFLFPHSESVTHVVSENNCGSEVRTWLDSQVRGGTPAHLLDISWYTESMKAGRPVEILDRHKLQVRFILQESSPPLCSASDTLKINIMFHKTLNCWKVWSTCFTVFWCNQQINRQLDHRYDWLCVSQEQQTSEAEVEVFSVPSYACQRRTTLENHNAVLTVGPPANADLHVRTSNPCISDALCDVCPASGCSVAPGRERWAQRGGGTRCGFSPGRRRVEGSAQTGDEHDGAQRASLSRRSLAQSHQGQQKVWFHV